MKGMGNCDLKSRALEREHIKRYIVKIQDESLQKKTEKTASVTKKKVKMYRTQSCQVEKQKRNDLEWK